MKATTAGRTIQSLDRAFDILDALGKTDSKGLSLKDICAVTELNPSTAHHLLGTMVSRGYVSQNVDSRRYALGSALLRLQAVAAEALDLRAIAAPFAQELLARTAESVYVSVLQDWDFPALLTLPSPQAIRFVRQPAPQPCLHAAAAGRCLLAYQPPDVIERYIAEVPLTRFTAATITQPAALRAELERIRASGIVYDHEQTSPGATCLASPIFGSRGEIVATLSMSSPTFRASPDKLEQWAGDVRELAAAISHRIGFE